MKKINNKKFRYQTKTNLPNLDKVATEWNLAKLYYKNDKDKRIEEDIQYAISTYQNFAKKWRNKPFTTNKTLLLAALTEYETLTGNQRLSKPTRYFSLRLELDVTDDKAEKSLALIRKRLRPATDGVLFFGLDIGKISLKLQKEILRDKKFTHFVYYLKQIFQNAKHDLSEAEEKIIRLKAPQATGLWLQMTEKLISTAKINWKGKLVPVPEALELIETLPSQQKPKLWEIIIKKIDAYGIEAEHEFNAIIMDVRTEDDLRKYEKPYSATALAYQHNEAGIEALVNAISDKGFKLSKKFYKQKASYHGVPALAYAQKYDTIGEDPVISFAEAVTICRDVFYQVNGTYGQIFDKMLCNSQIDVYPKANKRGGAFMSDQTGHPIQVLLNHTPTFKALETLAHEMGHAVHASRSATNSPFYDGHSIVTAETASTLFENLVFDAIISQADENLKLLLLHDRITRDIATMQRQIAFFNCELEIHNTIYKNGAMTHGELKNSMYKHLRSYLGEGVTVTPEDGASYIYIPHLRYGFYVYSYTFGHLMSSTMARYFKADNSYRREIDTFLTSGSSDNVDNIFKKIGLDTTKIKTFTDALDAHARDIETFGKLVSKKKGVI